VPEGNYSAGDDDFDPAADAPGELIVLTAPENPDGTRIDLFLSRLVPQFSRARLQNWLDAGRIMVDGVPAGTKTRLLGGEAIELLVAPTPEQNAFAPEPVALDIVHEDADVIVLNKPSGLVVHPAAGNWSGTVLNGLLHHAPALGGIPRAGIVHRLDKETSGLMVVAKTLEAQTALVRQLQARSVRREYLAVAAGAITASGTIDAPIGRHPTQRKLMAVLEAAATGAKPAVTHYRPLAAYARGATLVECRLETGRTHQIRVHLRHIGHPLVGDQVYGTLPSRAWFGRQALHAARLAFLHPANNQLVAFEAAPPADMAALMAELANP
jgi:23S rRNA pseudouridine1911/1915/1917 synthase